MTTWTRRSFLKGLGTSAMALSLGNAFPKRASAFTGGNARRVIFYYFPDGVVPSLWRTTSVGSLSPSLSPLQPYANQCLFLNGLTMNALGHVDSSHLKGAPRLLTGWDEGGGPSIDQVLARSVGADSPFPHVYLGSMVMIRSNDPGADHYISYPSAKTTANPENDPAAAFQRLFGTPGGGGGSSTTVDKSILDAEIDEINDLRAKLGTLEKSKLDIHLQSIRDFENRLVLPPPDPGTCNSTAPGSIATATSGGITTDSNFPNILRAQMDVMVNAMACGKTRVGVVQASHHTSELLMNQFPNQPFSGTNNMGSHTASHYGGVVTTDLAKAFIPQINWWVQQLAYLLGQLKARPEGDGTMLDYSMVLICTEISDGNEHNHTDMPFVLCGGGGGRLKTGQVLDVTDHQHSDLYIAMARAMGSTMTTFGQGGTTPLPGVLA